MSKFKVRFNIEKLSLEIEGERDAIPAVTNALKEQMAGLLQSPAAVAVEEPKRIDAVVTPMFENPANGSRKRKVRTAERNGASTSAVDFRHDPSKLGNPKQEWTTQQKAIWLLQVVAEQTPRKEMSHSEIAETFNKHFRQAKAIQPGNVSRDLGKAKLLTPALVGEDTSKAPSMWYLTNEGVNFAKQLSTASNGVP